MTVDGSDNGTINVYFSPIPLLYPPTFLSRSVESEHGKRRVKICRNPFDTPHTPTTL
jgi:hypothetical protein